MQDFNPEPSTSGEPDPTIEQARSKTDQMLQAERFKASVNALGMNNVGFSENQTGKNNSGLSHGQGLNNVMDRVELDMDNQFFHVTCHVEPNLRAKIQWGEYFDLEKLLPKSKMNKGNDNKMDLVFREGHSYFIPATSDMKITYAAIYSQANPTRAAEIWQYVHIINMAASSYIWENVANYDFTFRQLMSTFPQRNWVKIYNQMWSIAMHDPIPKQGQNTNQYSYNKGGFGSNNTNNQNSNTFSGNNQGTNKRRPNYCWTFNKGNCKDGSKCKFVNRCSYCDSAEHSIFICPRAKKVGVTIAMPTQGNK